VTILERISNLLSENYLKFLPIKTLQGRGETGRVWVGWVKNTILSGSLSTGYRLGIRGYIQGF
jgi:hypothetical protein